MKKPVRWLLRAGKFCLFLFILLMARYWWANRQPVVSFPAPIPTPSPNGIDLYVKAANLVSPDEKPVDEAYDKEFINLTDAEKRSRYSLSRREAWLKQNRQAFAAFKQAQQAQSLQAAQSALTSNLSSQPLRQMARYKVAEANTFKLQNQWGAAANSCLDVFEMSNDIQTGGTLIDGLVGIACEAIAMKSFEEIPPHLTLKETIATKQRLNQLLSARPRFSVLLTADKYSVQQALLNQWATADASHHLFIPSINALFLSLLWTRQGFINGNDTMMNAFIAEADKPYRLQKPVSKPNLYFDSLNLILYEPVQRGLFNSTRSLCEPRLQLVRLALREYRLKNGHYPDNLSELAQKYLSTLSIDPYGSGETFHYRKSKDSYTVWSIGPDGKDNGGTPIKPKRRQKRVVIWTDSLGDVSVKP